MRRAAGFRLIMFYSLVLVLFFSGTFLGNRFISVIYENQPINREKHIVIDPGHGGEDGGAISYSGKLESNINLEISLRLRDVFHLLGWDTVMIRTTDTAVYKQGNTIAQKKVSDLKERVHIVNETENAVLISIHQNYFSESQYSGAQVFFGTADSSQELAKELQVQLVSNLNPGSNRKEKKGTGIYLLEHADCSSVLVECGFLSNPREENLLCDNTYQKKISQVISATVTQYLANT